MNSRSSHGSKRVDIICSWFPKLTTYVLERASRSSAKHWPGIMFTQLFGGVWDGRIPGKIDPRSPLYLSWGAWMVCGRKLCEMKEPFTSTIIRHNGDTSMTQMEAANPWIIISVETLTEYSSLRNGPQEESRPPEG